MLSLDILVQLHGKSRKQNVSMLVYATVCCPIDRKLKHYITGTDLFSENSCHMREALSIIFVPILLGNPKQLLGLKDVFLKPKLASPS